MTDKKTVNYPQVRSELLVMLSNDQSKIKEYTRAQFNKEEPIQLAKLKASITRQSKNHIKRTLEILNTIEPTIDNIGDDGTEAIAVIALHSNYKDMKSVLKILKDTYKIYPKNTYKQAIPALKDRVLIIEHKKQIFGTQWGYDESSNTWYLFPVKNFKGLSKLRANYGLGKLLIPINVALEDSKNPTIRTLATSKDQRLISEEEYKEYARNFID
jgi:hypothetical protein